MEASALLPFIANPSSSPAVALAGVVDYRGYPAFRSSSGRWTAALFIIWVEIAERFAYYGIFSNLITYLTGSLQESTAAAAAGVNTLAGVAMLLPLAGAFVADSYLGRYRTILFSSLLYILGLGLLTLSSVLPSLRPPKCMNDDKACSPNYFQTGFFYFALYLVAIAQGGHKPCTEAFGADQFDEKDPEESISRSSFFNWWYCGLCFGVTVTTIFLNYVQDNISWAVGYGISFISMGLALILFVLGTKTYRFYQLEGESPFLRIGKTLVALLKSWMGSSHASSDGGLDRTKLVKDAAANDIQIEEARGVLQLVPIWAACLTYAVVYAQSATFFTQQGSTLDRRIGSNFKVPPAALQSFISITIVAFIPIYDQILVPVSRKFSSIPTGITQLQRIGIGMFFSVISMVLAALVEIKRLKTAKDHGLIDLPKMTIPMSLWWLVPQYLLYGITEVFVTVGLQEFFYDQVPNALRSLGLALCMTIFGVGYFISSFLISVIDKATSKVGESWFSDNLNRAHLDYFYWLLGSLNAVGLITYLYFARSYVYKKKKNAAVLSPPENDRLGFSSGMDSCPVLPFISTPAVALVGVVDYRGYPAFRSSSGRWTAALFIIWVEIAERFAYYGISSNLITYLTGPLQESTAAAAAGVNTWAGVAMMLPLAGAFVADSYLGRYRTILFSSLLYILGLGLLTLSSVLPSLRPPKCMNDDKACSPNYFQTGFFYFALYLVAIAQGGHKPCTEAFGADQFDEKDPEESISRSSFFNWWYCGLCFGVTVTTIFLNYVQDNISWAVGYGISFISMGLALILFVLGTKTYRFYQLEGESPFLRIGKTLVALLKSWMVSSHASSDEGGLDRTKLVKDEAADDAAANDIQIEEARGVLQLVPIWAACLTYAVVFAQSSTFFTKQGTTLDRRIGSNFKVPPAALQSFISITIVAFIPIYDQILVPVSRKFSSIPTGITQLQRIGIGMFFSVISMVLAALVEIKRLKTAKDHGLIDLPKMTIPMSLWWLVPQYLLYGITEVFVTVGLQEFFYDQVPNALRSLGLALYMTIFGIGNFISSFLIAVIDKATSKAGESWFSDNLNRAHLDYFYWLLGCLNAVGLIIYLYLARSYVYKKKQNAAVLN
ncbi:LOW QUALITY PROTEIN: uncharacterized protein LOC110019420 [Phalaenopsis equestris]|uniref:LOW QUALITY PROTEIN: uncharacterized protein LOC110019420 n=1 Tax=Phalaenopsis equestris TaxID=78828 RepID=UPI0009E36443|nr:LOW QUALITY PROTEIN: uncharacterized protein LOC110019420 [Phalaenopsis equestris]